MWKYLKEVGKARETEVQVHLKTDSEKQGVARTRLPLGLKFCFLQLPVHGHAFN